MLLSAPKYGNDDDYVDLIFKEWMSFIAHEIMSYRDSWGAPYNSDVASFTRNVTLW